MIRYELQKFLVRTFVLPENENEKKQLSRDPELISDTRRRLSPFPWIEKKGRFALNFKSLSDAGASSMWPTTEQVGPSTFKLHQEAKMKKWLGE